MRSDAQRMFCRRSYMPLPYIARRPDSFFVGFRSILLSICDWHERFWKIQKTCIFRCHYEIGNVVASPEQLTGPNDSCLLGVLEDWERKIQIAIFDQWYPHFLSSNHDMSELFPIFGMNFHFCWLTPYVPHVIFTGPGSTGRMWASMVWAPKLAEDRQRWLLLVSMVVTGYYRVVQLSNNWEMMVLICDLHKDLDCLVMLDVFFVSMNWPIMSTSTTQYQGKTVLILNTAQHQIVEDLSLNWKLELSCFATFFCLFQSSKMGGSPTYDPCRSHQACPRCELRCGHVFHQEKTCESCWGPESYWT